MSGRSGEASGARLVHDRYQIQERIGFGGMGAVYTAHDRVMDRRVAVKELRHEYAQDEMLRRRFIREAQAAGGLSHPHIVTVHDLIEQGDSLFIVMEYLDGGTLLDRMNAAPGRRMDPPAALKAAREALLGLEAAHEEGLVHRDIKPGNLLFDHRGRVKIADFGVVTARRHEDAITALTQIGTHPGTLVYMSPEQIDGAEVDGRSDVYSMAAVLYEALAGARYFERPGIRTERALMDAICDEPPVPLRERVPYVSEAVERLVHQALVKAAEERPSAAQLAAAIGAVEQAPRPQPQILAPQIVDPPPEAGGLETRPAAGRLGALQPPSASRLARPGETAGFARGPAPTTPARPEATETRAASLSDSGRVPRIEVPTPRPRPSPSRRTTEKISLATIAAEAPAGARRRDGAVTVPVSAGVFLQGGDGASDERPQREVELSGYRIDRTPVTVGQYRAFLAAVDAAPSDLPLLRTLYPNGKDHRPQGWGTAAFEALCPSDDHPVVGVDWFDACAYAAWVGASLPTEAQWELAARGAAGRTFPWGEAAPTSHHALFGRRSVGPQPVGRCREGATPEGVLDLAGNVWEWCLDAYDPRAYALLPRRDPHLEVRGPRAEAVKRGGSWTNAAHSLRAAKRGCERLHVRRNNLGFRCAQPL